MLLQDSTTLSTFSRPLFGLIIHVYYGAVKKKRPAHTRKHPMLRAKVPETCRDQGMNRGSLSTARISIVGGQSIEASQPDRQWFDAEAQQEES